MESTSTHGLSTSSDTPWLISLGTWGSGTSALIQPGQWTPAIPRTPKPLVRVRANQQLHPWWRGSGTGLLQQGLGWLWGEEAQNSNVRRTTPSDDVCSKGWGFLPQRISHIPSQSTAKFQHPYQVFPIFLAVTTCPGNISSEGSFIQEDFDGFFPWSKAFQRKS